MSEWVIPVTACLTVQVISIPSSVSLVKPLKFTEENRNHKEKNNKLSASLCKDPFPPLL